MQTDTLPRVTKADEFDAWQARAAIGDVCVYHLGDLAFDRGKASSRMSDRDRQRLDALASTAWEAAQRGPRRMALTQRRIEPSVYEYRAERVS